MISVVCGHIEGDNLFIHEFVMSCRVLARGVEQFILNSLVSYSRNRGVKCLIGEYLPTAKNGLVSDLYPRLGFQSDGHSPNRWVLCLDGFTPLSTHVNERPEEAA